MKNKKTKKRIIRLFAIIQIFLLALGNVSPAAAVWTSLRNETSSSFPSGSKDDSEYNIVSAYKKSDQTPKVSVIFSSSNPKAGDEVTATAVATPFANSEENLYYTWFLKRKGCDVEGDDKNRYAISSTKYDPGDDGNYPDYAEILAEDSKAAACDADKDGLVTSHDWRVEAARIAVQKGFKPDLGGAYSTLDEFYNEDGDADGYQVWQGGADAERMPNHCYGYDATSGFMFEFLDQYIDGAPMCPNPDGSDEKIPAVCGLTVNATLANASEDPCVCGPDDVDSDGYLDIDHCNSCVDGYVNSSRVNNSNLWPVPSTRVEPPDTFWPIPADTVDEYSATYDDGLVQWWECEIDKNYCDPDGSTYDGDGNVVGAAHMDCAKNTTYEACKKETSYTPYCSLISSGDKAGQYAALCGTDANGDGLDDNAGDVAPGVAMCPINGAYQIGSSPFSISQGDFNSAITSGLTYQDDEYVFGRLGKHDPLTLLPACNCYKTGTMENPAREESVPYTGSTSNPLCSDSSPEIDDLLCGSLTRSSKAKTDVTEPDEQFHVFPQRLSHQTDGVVPANHNYYDLTRDYAEGSDEKFTYIKGTNTGNNTFNITDERYWGTDPRNSSTAQNGKSDEANLVGLGATTFTWTYAEGDSVGVAVEGTSNIGTKFPDSSRMIMWAFSKGASATTSSDSSAEAACQPKYSGTYKFKDFTDMQWVGPGLMLPNTLYMPTGFMDFDACIEKSIVPLVVGDASSGAQPKAMEVELDATPEKPLNDENGEGNGDVVDVQAIISGNEGSESDISYSWKIKVLRPEIDANGATKVPVASDWEDVTDILCEDGDASCPLEDGDGGDLKLKAAGLSGISFKLDIVADSTLYDSLFNDNGEGYFQVSVEAREDDDSTSPPASRVGTGEVAFKVNTNENRITVFRPTISGGLLSSPGTQFCMESDERSLCSVLKNEIVGLAVGTETKDETITDFSWFVNGNGIENCSTDISNNCISGTTASNYVPVTGDVGETFTVSVKGTNVSGKDGATGKNVELFQQFKIVEPSINIVSANEDTVWPKLIGSTTDPTTGESSDDYSKSVLETAAGNSAELDLDYTPSFLADLGLTENWQIDGSSVDTPTFTAGEVGDIHNISASVTYSQSTEMYSALFNLFKVSKSEMKAQTTTDSIQVEVNDEAESTALKNPTRFMANLLSKVPSQILFFIRLILSVSMTIVLVGVIFAFFPETAYDKRRI